MILDQNPNNIKPPQDNKDSHSPLEYSKEFTKTLDVVSFPDKKVINNLLNISLNTNKHHTITKNSQAQKRSLGTYAELSAKPENKGIQPVDKKRYRLGKLARKLVKEKCMKKHRIAECHYSFVPHANPTLYDNGAGHGYSWGNVVKCSSPYCPICSVRISHDLRGKLARAVSNGSAQGLKVVMMTLTCQHDARHRAGDNVNAMISAWNKFRGHRKYKELFDANGVVGYIRVTDETFNSVNGSHFHFHVLLFIESDKFNPDLWTNNMEDDNSLWWQIVMHWDAQLDKLNRTCAAQYAVDIREADTYVADYIAKIGHEPGNSEWDITAEAALSPLKRGHDEHYTLFQLLVLADKGDDWAGLTYAEYVDAMKHRSRVQWSKGLQERLEIIDTIEDENPVDDSSAEEKPQFVATRPAWRYIREDRNLRADLLVAANNGDYELVARELAKCDVIGLFLQNTDDSSLVDGWHKVTNYNLHTAQDTIIGRVYVHQGKIADAHASVVIIPPADKISNAPGTHKMSDKPACHKPGQLVLWKGGDTGDNV